MPHPKVKLSDDSGNEVGVTSNRLNVNAYLAATPTIDIGDVSLLLGGTAADTGLGTYGAQTLRVTMAADDVLLGQINTNIVDCEALLTGLSRTEDAAHSSGERGIMSLAVRNDTLASLVSDDGDYTPLQVNPLGALYVDIDDSNTCQNSGDAFNAFDLGIPSLAVRNDTLGNLHASVASGDYTNLQLNSIGGLYVTGSEVENAAVQSEPLLIGGRYDSSARTLGSGDAGAVALNASGHVLMDVVDGGQLDTIIDTLETTLTAIETDQAAIEVLLTGIDSDTDAIKTAVQILDDWDDSNYANVNINLAGSDAPTGGGAESGALRVTIANDSTGVLTVDNAGTFAVQSTLQAGSAAIGKLAANSGVDIGDVDVTSISAGTNIIGKVGHDITGGADGVTTVSSAGTDVVLGGNVVCKKIDIQAQTDNTGLIAVGFTGVDATEATGTGIILYAGDTYSLEMVNLNLIYIDSTVSGEGVRYTYFT